MIGPHLILWVLGGSDPVAAFDELSVHQSISTYLDDNFTLTGSTQYDSEPFDIDSAAEAVQFDIPFYNDRIVRKTSKRIIDVSVQLKIWVKQSTNRYRIHEIVDLLDGLFDKVTVEVKDYDVSGDPRVGWVRFQEPVAVDQSPVDSNISCYLMTIQGVAQEE